VYNLIFRMELLSNWKEYAVLRDSIDQNNADLSTRPDVSVAFEAFIGSYISHEEALRGSAEDLEKYNSNTNEKEVTEWKEVKEGAIRHILDLFLQYFSVCDDINDDEAQDDLLDVLSWCRSGADNNNNKSAFMMEGEGSLDEDGSSPGRSSSLFDHYDANMCNTLMHFVFDELVTTASDSTDDTDANEHTPNEDEMLRIGSTSSLSSAGRSREATPTNIIPTGPPSPVGIAEGLSNASGAGRRSRSISISRSSVSSSQSLQILSQLVEEKNSRHYRQKTSLEMNRRHFLLLLYALRYICYNSADMTTVCTYIHDTDAYDHHLSRDNDNKLNKDGAEAILTLRRFMAFITSILALVAGRVEDDIIGWADLLERAEPGNGTPASTHNNDMNSNIGHDDDLSGSIRSKLAIRTTFHLHAYIGVLHLIQSLIQGAYDPWSDMGEGMGGDILFKGYYSVSMLNQLGIHPFGGAFDNSPTTPLDYRCFYSTHQGTRSGSPGSDSKGSENVQEANKIQVLREHILGVCLSSRVIAQCNALLRKINHLSRSFMTEMETIARGNDSTRSWSDTHGGNEDQQGGDEKASAPTVLHLDIIPSLNILFLLTQNTSLALLADLIAADPGAALGQFKLCAGSYMLSSLLSRGSWEYQSRLGGGGTSSDEKEQAAMFLLTYTRLYRCLHLSSTIVALQRLFPQTLTPLSSTTANSRVRGMSSHSSPGATQFRRAEGAMGEYEYTATILTYLPEFFNWFYSVALSNSSLGILDSAPSQAPQSGIVQCCSETGLGTMPFPKALWPWADPDLVTPPKNSTGNTGNQNGLLISVDLGRYSPRSELPNIKNPSPVCELLTHTVQQCRHIQCEKHGDDADGDRFEKVRTRGILNPLVRLLYDSHKGISSSSGSASAIVGDGDDTVDNKNIQQDFHWLCSTAPVNTFTLALLQQLKRHWSSDCVMTPLLSRSESMLKKDDRIKTDDEGRVVLIMAVLDSLQESLTKVAKHNENSGAMLTFRGHIVCFVHDCLQQGCGNEESGKEEMCMSREGVLSAICDSNILRVLLQTASRVGYDTPSSTNSSPPRGDKKARDDLSNVLHRHTKASYIDPGMISLVWTPPFASEDRNGTNSVLDRVEEVYSQLLVQDLTWELCWQLVEASVHERDVTGDSNHTMNRSVGTASKSTHSSTGLSNRIGREVSTYSSWVVESMLDCISPRSSDVYVLSLFRWLAAFIVR
jgi:hypothetical protein